MKLKLFQIPAEEWKHYSFDAHKAVFDEILPRDMDRIDYALLAVDMARDVPVAYMTCREFDRDTIYLKHGGAFAPIRGTLVSLPCYKHMLSYLEERYKNLTTLVENTNTVYLKMALTCGFKVIGVRNYKGVVLLELFKEVL